MKTTISNPHYLAVCSEYHSKLQLTTNIENRKSKNPNQPRKQEMERQRQIQQQKQDQPTQPQQNQTNTIFLDDDLMLDADDFEAIDQVVRTFSFTY
jgi:hypothetical protein